MLSECLDCLVGGFRVAVPVDGVSRIVKYDVFPPPPLARPWVGGIGNEGDTLFLSLALLDEEGRRPPRRSAQGLLVRAAAGTPPWAVEVDQVSGIRWLELGRPPARLGPGWACPGEWLRTATDTAVEEETRVPWLDVRLVEKELNTGGAR